MSDSSQEIPAFADLASDPEIAPLLGFDPVVRKRLQPTAPPAGIRLFSLQRARDRLDLVVLLKDKRSKSLNKDARKVSPPADNWAGQSEWLTMNRHRLAMSHSIPNLVDRIQNVANSIIRALLPAQIRQYIGKADAEKEPPYIGRTRIAPALASAFPKVRPFRCAKMIEREWKGFSKRVLHFRLNRRRYQRCCRPQ